VIRLRAPLLRSRLLCSGLLCSGLLGLVFLVGIPARPAAAAPADENFQFPYRLKVFDLPNGLRVVMVPMPTPGVVSFQTIVRAGSRNELEPGRTGYAHFFEHMMFRGTARFDEETYGRVLAELGADGNASTGNDQTSYYNTIPASGLAKVIEMEADRFQNLRYTQEQFRKEAGAILGEFSIGQADPGTVLEETRAALAFRLHPYGHTVIGKEADVRAMPGGYDYSLQFYDHYYRPEYCTLLFAGDFDSSAVEQQVRREYADWKRGGYVPPMPVEPPLDKSVRQNLTWNGPTRPTLELSFRTPAFSDQGPTTAALELVREIYFGATSDLYRKLVEGEKLAESVNASFDRTRDPGLFTITARLKKPEDFETVRMYILAAVAQATTSAVPPNRLAAAKRHLVANIALMLEAPSGAARRVAEAVSLTGDPKSVERYYRRLASLEPRNLQDAASTWLNPNRSITLTMTGKEGRP
jgi:zinc protease